MYMTGSIRKKNVVSNHKERNNPHKRECPLENFNLRNHLVNVLFTKFGRKLEEMLLLDIIYAVAYLWLAWRRSYEVGPESYLSKLGIFPVHWGSPPGWCGLLRTLCGCCHCVGMLIAIMNWLWTFMWICYRWTTDLNRSQTDVIWDTSSQVTKLVGFGNQSRNQKKIPVDTLFQLLLQSNTNQTGLNRIWGHQVPRDNFPLDVPCRCVRGLWPLPGRSYR